MESARHIRQGKEAEAFAADYLSMNGYKIIAKNYRHRRGEIDLIVKIDNLLVFVEVKYRKNIKFGFPEEFVDGKKQELILNTAEAYVFEYNWTGDIRFDIIAINGNNKIEHLQDVF